MNITDISERTITLILDPEDAQRLARACMTAAQGTGGDNLCATIFGENYLPVASAWYEVAAIAFESAGMASVAYSYIGEHTNATTGERTPDFTLDNVRAHKIGDKLW